MDDSPLFEVDLDEEKAKRSILVTDVPENVSPKDVVIHFQKGSTGGGEVVNLDEHHNEHRSSVVITFEHPSIVEKAIARPHIINDNKVNVQRYPVGTKIPEIFSHVDARINLNFFGGSVAALEEVFLPTQREFGIQLQNSPYGYVISGSYKQILLCRKHILREISNAKVIRQASTGSGDNDIGAKAASPAVMGATSRSTGTTNNEKIDVVLFQSVPIILEFIFTVERYKSRIQDIESEFNVRIEEAEGGMKVKIIPLLGCTRIQHDDACEEYIKFYREIYDGPMMSQDMLLMPGNGSLCSAEDAVMQVLESKPIAIQKMDEQDKWLFYGEEKNVRSAIKEICKMLMIANPLKRPRKTKVRYVPSDKENIASAPYSQTPSRSNGEEDLSSENPNDVRNPVHKDFPNATGQRLMIETKKGFRLTAYQGDITQEQVGVIVNFTDKFFSFSKGLAASVLKNGGDDIREDIEKYRKTRRSLKPGEVVSTRPGKLNCSRVMHILTNKYNASKGESEEKRLVKESTLCCLKSAKRMECKSIAFPAVGAGQQGMPLDVCVSTMISAVEEYMKETKSNKNPVTDIRFVHLDPAAVEAFKAELTRRYKDSIVTPPDEADNFMRSKHSTTTLPNDKDNKKTENKDEEDVCPICLDEFHDPVALSKCNHKFCKKCIDLAFKHRKVCPTCGKAYGVQTGNMPPGTMKHYFDSYRHLPGYERCGTIRIDYYLPCGTQGPEHPNPGQWYDGASRTAYLPDCPEGREVLGLLKKAFDARLTFTIGRSVTTGASNVVTWNDIHHKTSPYGGATGFGYPDPTYLKRVKEELAAKGIS